MAVFRIKNSEKPLLLPLKSQIDGGRVFSDLSILPLQLAFDKTTLEGAVIINEQDVTIETDHAVDGLLLNRSAMLRISFEAGETLAVRFFNDHCLNPLDRTASLETCPCLRPSPLEVCTRRHTNR